MSIRRDFPDLPPLWALAFALISYTVGRIMPIEVMGRWRFLLALACIAAGVALIAWAVRWFREKRTNIEPREEPSVLLVEGPFRINRNPIYTGLALCVLGIALFSGGASAIPVALIFPFVVDRRFVRGEERVLRETFGEEAEAYFRRSRRW